MIMVSDGTTPNVYPYAKFNFLKVMLLWRIRNDGFALPAAIGAKMGREVVAVIGDGGFQMTIRIRNHFQTKVPVKIVIL
jgi:acetolactate synthase-1/2/3 large subunit